MGVDDYHVSQEDMERTFAEYTRKRIEARRKDRLQRYKKVEALAYKWFDGEIDDKRMAEAVFGLINEEAIL
jgi:hypothetical protein